MSDGDAGEEGVDGANLRTAPAAVISERRSLHVIVKLGHNDREKREIPQDPPALDGSLKPLKELLDDEACGDDQVLSLQAPGKQQRFGSRRGGRPAKSQRPNAGIDENVHVRERSAL